MEKDANDVTTTQRM